MITNPTTAVEPAPPLRFDRRHDGWVVGSVEFASSVLRRHDEFGTEGYRAVEADLSDIRRFLLAPPAHHRMLRRLMVRTFAAGPVRAIDDAILTPAASRHAAALPREGLVDLQTHFIVPYTREAMFGIIGADSRSGDELCAIFRVCSDYWVGRRDRARGTAALLVLRSRAAEICANGDGRRPPASLLARAHDEGWLAQGPGIEDLVCLMMSLIEAVAVKAHRDLTASLLRRVSALPSGQQRRLVKTGAFGEAVDEAVRLQNGGYLPRTALKDTTLGDHRIQAGDRVFIDLGAVGRDRAVYDEPERFDPWRRHRAHPVSFGIGLHRCAGENVARQIAVRACRTLLDRWRLTMIEPRAESFDVELTPWP